MNNAKCVMQQPSSDFTFQTKCECCDGLMTIKLYEQSNGLSLNAFESKDCEHCGFHYCNDEFCLNDSHTVLGEADQFKESKECELSTIDSFFLDEEFSDHINSLIPNLDNTNPVLSPVKLTLTKLFIAKNRKHLTCKVPEDIIETVISNFYTPNLYASGSNAWV